MGVVCKQKLKDRPHRGAGVGCVPWIRRPQRMRSARLVADIGVGHALSILNAEYSSDGVLIVAISPSSSCAPSDIRADRPTGGAGGDKKRSNLTV